MQLLEKVESLEIKPQYQLLERIIQPVTHSMAAGSLSNLANKSQTNEDFVAPLLGSEG